jgi:hypothetical protein
VLEFFGSPPSEFALSDKPILNYTISGLRSGLKDIHSPQGPFEATFHNGSVCMAQYPYYLASSDTLYKSASIKYECRFLVNSKNLMICEGALEGDWSIDGINVAKYVDKPFIYQGFAKEQ